MMATIPVTATSLKCKLQDGLQATFVDIEDISGGCGKAFSCVIVSPLFENKTNLARHRLVNAFLKEEIANIHAWTAKCYTPTQWLEVSVSKVNFGDSQGEDGEGL